LDCANNSWLDTDAAAEIARATNRRVKGFVADTGNDASVKTGVTQTLGEFNDPIAAIGQLKIPLAAIGPPETSL
jgi:hypothetical protein